MKVRDETSSSSTFPIFFFYNYGYFTIIFIYFSNKTVLVSTMFLF